MSIRLCVIGDLNRWVEDRVRKDTGSAYRVSDENDKGRRVVDFWAEKSVYVRSMYFKQKNIYINTLDSVNGFMKKMRLECGLSKEKSA